MTTALVSVDTNTEMWFWSVEFRVLEAEGRLGGRQGGDQVAEVG